MSYPAFRKIPRLERSVVMTEKIDGTNGLIYIPQTALNEEGRVSVLHLDNIEPPPAACEIIAESGAVIYAGSRNRWLHEKADNHGFFHFVRDQAEMLIETLGVGLHYGEWWGRGIQRGYGLDEKRFSLFNVSRWGEELPAPLGVVPVLETFPTMTEAAHELNRWARRLDANGSMAAPGYMNPEGIVLFHERSGQLFKYTLDGDGEKG